MSRAITYTRVSSDDQGDNFSLPTQLAACRTYAEHHGMVIVAELSDIMTGSTLDRPGLTKLRQIVSVGGTDAIIVYAQDRLTRSVAHMLLLRDEFRTAGVALHAVGRGQSAETPEGRLFDTIEASFAEYERLKIKERTARGKRGKVESGLILGSTTAPYGYSYEGTGRERQLVINEQEAEVVRQVARWYLDGVPVADIVHRLDAAGIPTPSQARETIRHIRGTSGRWKRATIYDLLRSPTIAGDVIYPQYDGIIVKVPAILDRAMWDQIQARLDVGKARSQRKESRFYLLRTRLTCSCGSAMFGRASVSASKAYRYYVCNAKDQDAVTPCPHRGIPRADILEVAVWTWLTEVVLDETRIIDALAGQKESAEDRRSALDAERSGYLQHMDALTARVHKLTQLFSADILTLAEVGEQKKAIDQDRARAQRELDRIAQEYDTTGPDPADVEAALVLAHQIRELLAEGWSDEVKAQVIALLDVHAVLVRSETGAVIAVDVEARLTGDVERLSVVSTSSRPRPTINPTSISVPSSGSSCQMTVIWECAPMCICGQAVRTNCCAPRCNHAPCAPLSSARTPTIGAS